MSLSPWNLIFSQELLNKKKQDAENKLDLQQRQNSRENNVLFDESGAYNKSEKTKDSYYYIKKSQENDAIKALTLCEYLKLENIDEYDKRIKHIIQTFHLSPIHLKISADIQKNLIQSILSEMNLPAKEIDIKISNNHNVIYYKNRLYVLSTIIITQEPSSSYDQSKFDINVFSENGDLICSFHNFESMERLIKFIANKFRRLQNIYFLHILDSKNAHLDQFLELKMILEVQKLTINLKGIFYSSQKDTLLRDKSNKVSNLHRLKDKKFVIKEDLLNFCTKHSIKLAYQDEDIEFQGEQQVNRKYITFIEAVLRKKQFDFFLLNFICYGDDKIIQYRKRNEISLRLINYCYEKIVMPNFIRFPNYDPSKIQQFFKNLIHQILAEKEKQQLKQLQRLKQQSLNHEPQKVEKCTRLCLKCKQKTRYRCKKCTLKYRMEVMLCMECFEDFHSQDYFNEHALPILTSKTRIQNGFTKYRYMTKRLKNQIQSRNRIRSQYYRLNMLKLNQINRDNQTKQNEQILDPLQKYQQMRNFIFICHQISQKNN